MRPDKSTTGEPIAKLILHGHWIYDNDTGWKLAVYPIATMSSVWGHQPLLVAKESTLPELGSPCDAIERIFQSDHGSIRSMTMYNLGPFEGDETPLDLYLVCPIANIKDGITHQVITKEGYMYVEDLGIGDVPEDDEPLDNAILDALSRLEAPHQFTVSN